MSLIHRKLSPNRQNLGWTLPGETVLKWDKHCQVGFTTLGRKTLRWWTLLNNFLNCDNYIYCLHSISISYPWFGTWMLGGQEGKEPESVAEGEGGECLESHQKETCGSTLPLFPRTPVDSLHTRHAVRSIGADSWVTHSAHLQRQVGFTLSQA